MERLYIEEIINSVKGELILPEGYEYESSIFISSVCIDSRKARENTLFAAFEGKNVDGHEYINDAANKGATVALAEKRVDASIPVICVENVRKALNALAGYYISKLNSRVVVCTGSSGKTTTKDMLFEVFKQKYKTKKSLGNLNNTIGMPMSVFSLDAEDEYGIFEIGIGAPGQMDEICSVCPFDIAVVTMIGSAHIENLGTRGNIFKEKTKVFANLKDNESFAVVNMDDEFLSGVNSADIKRGNMITYAVDSEKKIADITARDVEYCFEKCYTEYRLCYKDQSARVRLNTLGVHNVSNSLAAAAAGIAAGIDIESIARGLGDFIPDAMRMKISTSEKSWATVISDVYNSNPEACKVALNVLNDMPAFRRIAVLGDMLELGNKTQKAHTDVGEYASAVADVIIGVGKYADYIVTGAAKSMPYKKLYAASTNAEAKEILDKLHLCQGDIVLVKGSRGVGMEVITQYLLNGEN
ncbi:MAG: UDP-N-acetylmuramoyl-tripeptide--D-alanyl-D-alanine ligase [Clostridiales bacterium]|nr:UDP-N-acetylmuramoyl-tripeptide--D-alanyl-D-alanine ligase [Clostridiales bacterium]